MRKTAENKRRSLIIPCNSKIRITWPPPHDAVKAPETSFVMKIGFISPKWLPHHGGQQQYAHRLVLAMQGLGVETPIFCSTPEAENKDNGACEATRWSSPQL